MGSIFKNQAELHGRVITLVREGKERKGVIMTQDMKNKSGKFMFKWTSDNGKSSLGLVNDDELKNLQNVEEIKTNADKE